MSFPDYSKHTGYRYPKGLIKVPASECYSNLIAYGVHGAVNSIKAPQPVSLVPNLFNKLGRGHHIPKNPHHYNYPGRSPLSKNCGPYVTMNQACQKSEFNPMYYDRRNLN